MAKLTGTIQIKTKGPSDSMGACYEVSFLAYHGRLNAQPVRVTTQEDLVQFLMGIRLSEDDASRWAGRARSEGVLLIPGVETTDSVLKDSGLLA
jgi:hypothetical protein